MKKNAIPVNVERLRQQRIQALADARNEADEESATLAKGNPNIMLRNILSGKSKFHHLLDIDDELTKLGYDVSPDGTLTKLTLAQRIRAQHAKKKTPATEKYPLTSKQTYDKTIAKLRLRKRVP